MQTTVLDTRSFEKRTQESLVLSLFEGLKSGESFEVLADPGREQLCNQLDSLGLTNLKWEFLEKTPQQWKLKIKKLTDEDLATGHQNGGCCGSCGG